MKVLLVRPDPPPFTIGLKDLMICEPLELEYVAAGIKGHEVEIFDMILEKDLPGKLRSFKPDIVGTSAYITGVNKVKAICRAAKSSSPGVVTIVGGVQATLVPEDFQDPGIDIVVRGEGVRTISQIMECLDRGTSCEDVPNLAFPDKGGMRFSPTAALDVDVDRLPLPNRDLVAKFQRDYYYLFHQPVSIMKTTFGCPHRCTFCFCWPLTGGRVFRRSPASIADELEVVPSKDVYIVDDTFFFDPGHLRALHGEITRRGIDKRYLVYAQADFVARNPDLIRDWAEVGLIACIVGLETPFDHELQNYRKQTTAAVNTEAIRILKNNRVDVYGSFIVDPGWTEREFARLEDDIRKTGLYYIVIQPLTPLPGTEIFRSYADSLVIPRSQYELWDMQHAVLPTALPLRTFYRQIHNIYLRQCANPWRAHALELRTAPPVFSRKYLRLLAGGIRILRSLRKAHRHPQLLERRRAGP
jgi:radical SAM superfamily enzyme YgiQ (UPF0313 family)